MKREVMHPVFKTMNIHIKKPDPLCENLTVDWHIHEDMEIMYNIKKDKKLYIGNEEHIIHEGEICFINSNVPHKTYAVKDGMSCLIQLPPFDKENTKSNIIHFINYSAKDYVIFKKDEKVTKDLIKCFEDLFTEYNNMDLSYESFIKSDVQRIVAILYRNKIIKDPIDYTDVDSLYKIMPVLTYVEENYKNHIDLDSICKMMNINKCHFCRVFKKATNTSFIEYLNYIRICKATEELTTTDQSVSEIAENLGFCSLAYFTKIFKQYKECTPTQYRRYKNK